MSEERYRYPQEYFDPAAIQRQYFETRSPQSPDVVPGEVVDLAEELFEIYEQTDMPPFASTHAFDVTPSAISMAFKYLRAIPRLQGKLYPEELNKTSEPYEPDIPFSVWPANVHVYAVIFDHMNAIHAMQAEKRCDPELLYALAMNLYLVTTEANGETHLRLSACLYEGRPFPESRLRQFGVRGVNMHRHVTFQELMEQLRTVKEAFQKQGPATV
jgi:hypothetical protein